MTTYCTSASFLEEVPVFALWVPFVLTPSWSLLLFRRKSIRVCFLTLLISALENKHCATISICVVHHSYVYWHFVSFVFAITACSRSASSQFLTLHMNVTGIPQTSILLEGKFSLHLGAPFIVVSLSAITNLRLWGGENLMVDIHAIIFVEWQCDAKHYLLCSSSPVYHLQAGAWLPCKCASCTPQPCDEASCHCRRGPAGWNGPLPPTKKNWGGHWRTQQACTASCPGTAQTRRRCADLQIPEERRRPGHLLPV